MQIVTIKIPFIYRISKNETLFLNIISIWTNATYYLKFSQQELELLIAIYRGLLDSNIHRCNKLAVHR